MRTFLSFLLVLTTLLVASPPARADIPPPDACTALGASCNNAGPNADQPGTCQASTCQRATPSGSMSYPCNRCSAGSGSGGAGPGTGGAASSSGGAGPGTGGASPGTGGATADAGASAPKKDDSGCGCSLAAEHSSGLAGTAAALALAALIRRRRS